MCGHDVPRWSCGLCAKTGFCNHGKNGTLRRKSQCSICKKKPPCGHGMVPETCVECEKEALIRTLQEPPTKRRRIR